MLRKIFSYGTLAIISVLIQFILIIYAVTAGSKVPAVGLFYCLLTFGCVVHIVNSDMPCAYKLGWTVPMLIFINYGGVLYLLLNKQHSINSLQLKMKPYLDKYVKKIKGIIPENGVQKYLSENIGFPLLNSPHSHYFESGELLFDEMLKRISDAKHYIYFEFFIFADGIAWKKLEDLLKIKVSEGVTVRIIGDGAGCLFIKPHNFRKKLISMGIDYREFNRVGLRISGRVNYRSHRKILVCDGEYAFCCGINISDEYMNYKKRFGKWKDTGAMVSGDAALSFSAMFCGMWDYLSGTDKPSFLHTAEPEQKQISPLVQPFSDSPLDRNSVGLQTYLSLISSAQNEVILTTPYLICDDEMLNCLRFCARRGVKVTVITPGIPDKKYVYTLTRSFYKRLIESGVNIYEYTPGFIHSKTLLIDGKTAVIGSINFDYRSMYLLFECGCVFYGGTASEELKRDMINTISVCKKIKYEEVSKTGLIVRIVRCFLKLFAPLM